MPRQPRSCPEPSSAPSALAVALATAAAPATNALGAFARRSRRNCVAPAAVDTNDARRRSVVLHQAALAVAGATAAAARDNARSALRVVGQGGFEPPTSRLSSARSNQLSY